MQYPPLFILRPPDNRETEAQNKVGNVSESSG